MMYISFTHPFYLIFLFSIPLIIFLHFFSLKAIRGNALKFANFEAIARVKGIDIFSKNIFLLFFDILLVVLLVLSLSGINLHKEVDASSFSFVIAIDSSQSMSANDILPTRIDAAKETAKTFIDSSPYDSSIGIISFSGTSSLEQQITNNKQLLKTAIDNIQLSNTGGTDIYDAILFSSTLLTNEKNKGVIILSDGQINTGNVYDAIEYAKEKNILVHTIAIGTLEGGETIYGLSKVDEESLKSISYNTGGKFFSVQNKAELEQSFKDIIQVTRKVGTIELNLYILMLLIVLFIFRGILISMNKILW
ncbi:MAG: VWA domain-containing protein [Candidatus Pacearchaeota archaeon]